MPGILFSIINQQLVEEEPAMSRYTFLKRSRLSEVCGFLTVLVLATFVGAAARAAEATNPSVAFVQRTMARIAKSTPEKPVTVRFQFYGQSITAQPWTKLVQQDLATRFPSVKFIFHNPAIGGFTSPALSRTAEHDLYPWYPDILVFHVYGPVDKYEEIIRNVRARTTAEIVLWTSHLSANETLDKNPDADPRIVAIREIAKKYDCLLIDSRKSWIAHIQEKKLDPPALLSDCVHLNADGIQLLASFIAPELVRAPELATTAQAGIVTEIPLLGRIDEFIIGLKDVDRQLARGKEHVLPQLQEETTHIEDTVERLRDWASFQPQRGKPVVNPTSQDRPPRPLPPPRLEPQATLEGLQRWSSTARMSSLTNLLSHSARALPWNLNESPHLRPSPLRGIGSDVVAGRSSENGAFPRGQRSLSTGSGSRSVAGSRRSARRD